MRDSISISVMISDFDRVILTEDIPAKKLLKGDIGTVVMVHADHKGYEVEFFTLDGKTRAVETLNASQVRAVKANEVAHSRELV